jgi:hypothetical protein
LATRARTLLSASFRAARELQCINTSFCIDALTSPNLKWTCWGVRVSFRILHKNVKNSEIKPTKILTELERTLTTYTLRVTHSRRMRRGNWWKVGGTDRTAKIVLEFSIFSIKME